MQRVFLDFETRSRIDLTKVGSSLYARHPSTKALLLAYAFNNEPVDVIDFTKGEKIPKRLLSALTDSDYIKSCWNKSFEYQIFKHVLDMEIPHEQWQDTMVLAFHMSFPGQLDKAGPAIGMPEELFKSKGGKKLINRFSKPRKPTKTKKHVWDGWWNEPELWDEFVAYNKQDVEAERAIFEELRQYSLPVKRKWREHFANNPIPPREYMYWLLDQKINEKGVPVNLKAAQNAIKIANTYQDQMMAYMQDMTGLQNPNSTKQLLPWLQSEGYPFEDLKKSHVTEIVSRLEKKGKESDLLDILKVRQQVSKSSVKKYDAIARSVDTDGHVRYTLQFGGASRTNRHAGRILQPQNLPSPPKYLEDKQEELARDIETMSPPQFMQKYPDTMTALSAGIRPMIQAPKGYMFCDVDLGAIENRVLGWLAGDEKILDVFRKKQDPYLAFATHLTGRTYEDLHHEWKELKNKTVRTMAKPPTLGCFAADTLVLTARGYIPISEINDMDLLWDGCNWVVSDGYIYRGHKKTINIGGVNMTPDHKVLCGHDWVTADHLLADHRVLKRAYRTASTKVIINLRKERLHEPAARIDEEIATFDIVNCGPKNRFTILTTQGHLIVHNCGYRLGVGEQRINNKTGEMEATGLLGYAKNMGVELSPKEAKHAVTVFRETFTDVVQFWYDLERAVSRTLKHREPVRLGHLVFDTVGDFLRMILPSGRPIYYYKPRMEMVKTPWGEMRKNFTYYGLNDKKKWGKITSQGGKFAEQCLSADTKVLTQRGYKYITDVSLSDLLWDGENWVQHKGLIFKGIKPTSAIHGVYMTDDHLVLETDNNDWKTAETLDLAKAASTGERYYWNYLRSFNCHEVCRFRRETLILGSAMRMFKNDLYDCFRIYEEKAKIMWMQTVRFYKRTVQNTRDDGHSHIHYMAGDVSTVPQPQPQILQKLWRSGYNSLQRVASQFRKVLSRYESGIFQNERVGPNQQREGLLSRKRPLGKTQTKYAKYVGEHPHPYTAGLYDGCRSRRTKWNKIQHFAVSYTTRRTVRKTIHQTRRNEPVFDIKDAGPNNRFMVKGSNGQHLIVHNCTQATARDILMNGLVLADKNNLDIRFHVHDQIITLSKESQAEKELQILKDCMEQVPSWAPGLILGAEGSVVRVFQKD